jgi:hypothetical protein
MMFRVPFDRELRRIRLGRGKGGGEKRRRVDGGSRGGGE